MNKLYYNTYNFKRFFHLIMLDTNIKIVNFKALGVL